MGSLVGDGLKQSNCDKKEWIMFMFHIMTVMLIMQLTDKLFMVIALVSRVQ